MPRITKLGLLDLFIAGGNALTSLQLNISESQQIQACCDAHHVLHSEAVPSLGRVLYPPPTANSLGRQGWIASAARYKKIERSGTRQNMECLTCTYQRSITIPEGGVNAIAQNLRIRFEAEVVEYMSKIGTYDEKSCDACIDGSTGPAVAFCGTCRHLLCKHCHDHLKHGKIIHHHELVGLDKDSIKPVPPIMKRNERLCSQPHHHKEKKKEILL
ncbi:hypothetical protein EMCRGX_G000544 [Ephydatia muelleri]